MSDTQYPKRTRPGDYDPPAETANETPGGQQVEDPLAELARLIDEDPFADFNQRRREPYLTGNPVLEAQAPPAGEVPPNEAEAATGGLFMHPPEDLAPQDPNPQELAPETPPSVDLPPQAHDPEPASPSAEVAPGTPPYEAPQAEPVPYDDPVAAPFHPEPRAPVPDPGYVSTDHSDADPLGATTPPPAGEGAFAAPEVTAPNRRIEPEFGDGHAEQDYPAAEPAERIEPALFEQEIHRPEPAVAPQGDDFGPIGTPPPANPAPGDVPGQFGADEAAAPMSPPAADPDFDRDATERLYADLAAATQTADSSFEPPASEPPASDPVAAGPVTPEPAAGQRPYDPASDFEARLLEDLPAPADEVPTPVPPPPSTPAVSVDPSPAVQSAGEPRTGATGASPQSFDLGDLTGVAPGHPSRQPSHEGPAPAVDLSGLEAELANTDFTQTDPVFDESGHVPPVESEEAHAGSSRRRGLFILAGLIAVVVVGGAGAFFVNLFGGGDTSGPAPVIRADRAPTKVQPQQSGEEPAQEQGKLVYDRVSGDGSDENTQLVPRQEEVADVGGRQVRVINPNAEDTGLRGSASDTGAALLDEDAPKRVRTVVVKPDGTIVGEIEPPIEPQTEQSPSPAPLSQGQSGQQATLQPAPLPGQGGTSLDSGANQTATPGLQSDQQDTAALTNDAAAGDGGVPLPRPRPADVPRSEAAPVQTQSSQGAASNFVPPSAPSTTNTASRAGQPISLTPTGGQTQTAAAQTQTTTQATQQASVPQTTTFPAGSFVVQVAASRSEQDARNTAASITQRYSGQLSGYAPQVERADLGDRGIYYRVGVGPMNSQAAANTLCSQLKSAGLDCFVRRN